MNSMLFQSKIIRLAICCLVACCCLADSASGAAKKTKAKKKKAPTATSSSKSGSNTGSAGGVLDISTTAGTVNVNQGSLSGTGTYTGATSISVGTLRDSSGTLVLNNQNTFTGGITINGGVIQLGNAGALNSTTPGSAGSVMLVSGGTVRAGADQTNAFQRVNLTGATGVADLTYSGTTNVSSGTLRLDNTSAIAGSILNTSGGTFDVNGSLVNGTYTILTAGNINTLSADLAFAGTSNLNLGTGTVIVSGRNNYTLVAAGTLNGSAGLTKTSPGILTLSGTNTYTGGTTINFGTLNLGNSNTSYGGLTVTGGSGGVLTVGGGLTVPGNLLSTQYFATQNDKPTGYQKTLGHYVPLNALATNPTGNGVVGGTGVLVLSGLTIGGSPTSNVGQLLNPSNNQIFGPVRPAAPVFSGNIATVPEPNTIALAAFGLGSLFAGHSWRRFRSPKLEVR